VFPKVYNPSTSASDNPVISQITAVLKPLAFFFANSYANSNTLIIPDLKGFIPIPFVKKYPLAWQRKANIAGGGEVAICRIFNACF
jgi:hypothetical protein